MGYKPTPRLIHLPLIDGPVVIISAVLFRPKTVHPYREWFSTLWKQSRRLVRRLDWVNQTWPIIPHIAHIGRHTPDLHQRVVVWLQQIDRRLLRVSRRKPAMVIPRIDDERHAVVHECEQFIIRMQAAIAKP